MLKNDLIQKYIAPLDPRPTALTAAGTLNDNIKCVLFDVYGTLFVSGSGDISIARCETKKMATLENLLSKFGVRKAPDAILDDFFSAIRRDHQKQRENGIDFPEVEIDRIWMGVLSMRNLDLARAFAMEFELIVNPVYPMPNLERMLLSCRELNLVMGIISNAQFYTPFLFEWFLNANPQDLGFHPNLLLYSYRLGVAKPSTHMFESAAQTLKSMGIAVQAALYLGNDMLNDIYPARKVGFQTALFAGDARSLRLREDNPRCRDISPDIVITDLGQLPNYIR